MLKNKGILFLVIHILVIVLFFSLNVAGQQTKARGTTKRKNQVKLNQAQENKGSGKVVTSFIRAIQEKNYKEVIDLTFRYQVEIGHIKHSKPEVLWPKLIEEYYQQKIASFSSSTEFWQNYFETLQADLGDPVQAIRSAKATFPLSSKWEITELRNNQVIDNFLYGRYTANVVYVTINYATPLESPLINDKLLKQTILQFIVDGQTQLVRQSIRLSEGDTFWEKPPLHIINISWQGDSGLGFSPSFTFRIAFVGGTPPYRTTTQFGNYTLESFAGIHLLSRPDDRVITYQTNKFLPANLFPLNCTTWVEDSTGTRDTVLFVVPQMATGISKFCFTRTPWHTWNQSLLGFDGCRSPIFELKTENHHTSSQK